jgi:hypothetical protein
MEHQIKISITAKTEEEAMQIVRALLDIKNNLSDKDVKELAEILKKNPGIVKTAKKFLG